MKAILEFNLPEDQDDFVLATNGIKYYSCLLALQNYFRNKLKYSNLTENENKVYEKIKEDFFDILYEEGINLDEVS